MYNDKCIKTKIKIYNDKVYTNFQHNKIPKDNEYCACLSLIILDSILVNSDKEFYPQIFLEQCKYAMKNEIVNTINKDLELSEFHDESDDGYDEKMIKPYFQNVYRFNSVCYFFSYTLLNL